MRHRVVATDVRSSAHSICSLERQPLIASFQIVGVLNNLNVRLVAERVDSDSSRRIDEGRIEVPEVAEDVVGADRGTIAELAADARSVFKRVWRGERVWNLDRHAGGLRKH